MKRQGKHKDGDDGMGNGDKMSPVIKKKLLRTTNGGFVNKRENTPLKDYDKYQSANDEAELKTS